MPAPVAPPSAVLALPFVRDTASADALHDRVPAVLELSTGQRFHGWSFGARAHVAGEAVFQTGMVGYPEALSDPSYRDQLLILTYPIVGSYGVPDTDAKNPKTGLLLNVESAQIHAAALIVAEYTELYSHWAAAQSLSQWLTSNNVPAISGVDTRQLTKIIRDHGTMLARIVIPSVSSSPIPDFFDPNTRNLVADVAVSGQVVYAGSAASDPAAPHILAIDCGIKFNQLRILLAAPIASVTLVPWDHDFTADDAACRYDGIFISNGPGDPTMAAATIANLRTAMATRTNRPIFGICLGHQLLALAAGFSTYKLKYGNRGHNQPCIELATGRCYITSQNHGFAVDTVSNSAPAEWTATYVNANDGTNEGVAHKTKPFFSVQFHPEACAGPNDTAHLFDLFVNASRDCRAGTIFIPPLAIATPRAPKSATALSAARQARPKKVIVLGSGGLSIGQAGEFDYSGSQAIKALKEEGIRTVLINPNIATVQTSRGLADKVYFLPVTPENVVKVAEYERPDSILLTFGGQTALNCGVALYEAGEFERLGIKVLGTPVEAIMDTEDRERFNMRLAEINEPFAMSRACDTIESSVKAANEIGYPVILRAAFALGGLGSGFAHNDNEVRALADKAFSASSQVLVERSMRGWKEVEYEVVRDASNNCITVCNMENFDPLGVHTGDSIVVAPSQTLSDTEYNMLRDTAVRTVRHLGIVGECNIQYALNPDSLQYCIIEVNARLSRSSALASKATGYPLAFVAAKLSLGLLLTDIKNSITRETSACFEPSLDYIVVKVPRWDLTKFTRVSRKLGSSMKSVGEVMAVGRSFEEAIQKALRMVRDNYVSGFESGVVPYSDEEMRNPTENRVFSLASGLADGVSVEHIHELSRIDKWFLHKLAGIISFENRLKMFAQSSIQLIDLVFAKELGFSDRHIAKLIDDTELNVRKMRVNAKLVPRVKQIDTVAAEFPAKTNYLYVTYAGLSSGYIAAAADADIGSTCMKVPDSCGENDLAFDDHGVIVLGSGAYRIGSSVEFDCCAVSAIRTLSIEGIKSVMINYNPETVSTDYDECDRLYFEELSFERVLDVYELESSVGIVVSMGGQIPNNIAMQLHRQQARILGTTPEMIDGAENRYKFSRMLDRIGVDQPLWKELTSLGDARAFCNSVGYPVLVRPSFVLSGAAMNVAHKAEDLELYLTEAAAVSPDCPVVISKFILEAKEIEVDAVANKGVLMMHVVSEHVENAGVHSGDATLVLPPQDLDDVTVRKIEEATAKVALALNVTGPMNIQFIAKDNEIKMIECNLRASRSFPFVSKTIGLDLAGLAMKVMLDVPVKPYPVDVSAIPHVGVKVAMFSFTRLIGADPILGVEMASTGEVACFGATREEAYYKGLIATSRTLPRKTVGVSIGSYKEKLEFLASAKVLVGLGIKLIATPGTADFLQSHGVPAEVAVWSNPEEYSVSEGKNTIDKMLSDGRVEFFINIPSNNNYRRLRSFESPGYVSRRSAVDFNVPLLTNIKCAKMFVRVMSFVNNVGGQVPLAMHDSRFSSRVITLPGLVLLDSVIDSMKPASWSHATESALRGGFSVVCASTGAAAGSSESFAAESNVASKSAVCDFVLLASAQPGNAAVVKPLGRVAAGLKMSPSSRGASKNMIAAGVGPWLEHFESWSAKSPVVLESHGSLLAALLFAAVVSNRGVHVSHVSTRDDMALVRASKLRGLSVTCDVSVLDLYASPGSTTIKQADQEALWENLDVIDAITGPADLVLPLLLASVHEGRILLDWVVSRLVHGPRLILGLPSVEGESSMIEVDLNETWHGAAASGLVGAKCRGRVHRVVVDGNVSYLDGKVWAVVGSGRDLRSKNPLALTSRHSSATPALTRPPFSVNDPKPVSRLATENIAATSDREFEARMKARAGCVNGLFSSRASAVPSAIISKSSLSNGGDLLGSFDGLEKGGHGCSGVVGASLKSGIIKDVIPGYGTGWWSGRHILSVAQFTRHELHAVFEVAQEMRSMVSRVGHYDLLKGKIMSALFYEPSTRTSNSFQAAMHRLGGTCLVINDMANASTSKGESLADTIRTVCSYSDVIVIRHPDVGSAQEAAANSRLPVLNAGDGIGEHPSQAMLDVFTIREELGTVNGLTITFVGDLKNGRTVHSLAQLLSLYSVRINYVSPSELRVPSDVLEVVAGRGVHQFEHNSLDSVIQETDVLYITRMQKERFTDEVEYDRLKNTYVVTPKMLTRAKEHMIVMHPLPRVGEISPDVDSDPRAVYFRQMEYGLHIRMALLAMVLGKA
jgi:aspartate carbamoyltransferase